MVLTLWSEDMDVTRFQGTVLQNVHSRCHNQHLQSAGVHQHKQSERLHGSQKKREHSQK